MRILIMRSFKKASDKANKESHATAFRAKTLKKFIHSVFFYLFDLPGPTQNSSRFECRFAADQGSRKIESEYIRTVCLFYDKKSIFLTTHKPTHSFSNPSTSSSTGYSCLLTAHPRLDLCVPRRKKSFSPTEAVSLV